MVEDAIASTAADDFEQWANAGILRKLRTRGLTVDQAATLRLSFIENQISILRSNFQPFEIATNKGVADRVLFSLFGKGWGTGWKQQARKAEASEGRS